MKQIIFCCLLFILSYGVFGDWGSIPFDSNVKIFEPKQRALIAWNGQKEIMVISTDLQSSKPTKVLEVMPFPSEPKVEEGDIKVFQKAIDLINDKIKFTQINESSDALELSSDEESEPPPARLTFYERIGAHNISTIQLLKEKGFIKWVEKHLKSLNVEKPVIPEPMRKVIREYIRDGYVWFVFDVVSLTKKPKTKQAIKFTFESDHLYYPLRITRTESGETTVELIILTQELIHRKLMKGILGSRIILRHHPVKISAEELSDLGEDLFSLLGRPKTTKLRIWKIKGQLSAFKEDLLYSFNKLEKGFKKRHPAQFKSMRICGCDDKLSKMCFMNNAGGVFIYDNKSAKIKFLHDISIPEPHEIRKISYSSENDDNCFKFWDNSDNVIKIGIDGKILK